MKLLNKSSLLLLIFLFSCLDYNSIDVEDTSEDLAQSEFRIPIGDCSSYTEPLESFELLWDDLFSKESAGDSKGCTSCHDAEKNLGGWNLGNVPTKTETYFNIINRQGISGKTLIVPNNLEESEILIRLSKVENTMPQNGQLWFNTDLERLKRWICQGAENN